MTDQALQLHPFSFPPFLLAYLPSGISVATITVWMLYAIFVFWAIYTFVAVYHWLRYSHASWLVFLSIAIHILISHSQITYALGSGAFLLAPFLP